MIEFRLKYTCAAASVPPPEHTEFCVKIDSTGLGEVKFWPDYPSAGTPCWNFHFQSEEKRLVILADILKKLDLRSRPWHRRAPGWVGGSQQWLDGEQEGTVVQIPANLAESQAKIVQPLFDAIKSIVPETVWEECQIKRQEYIQQTSAL